MTSLEISRRLALSCKTIETYRSRLMIKLGAINRAALIRMTKDYDLPEA
jgi:DNA-binding NarL/FixJ family response regulator